MDEKKIESESGELPEQLLEEIASGEEPVLQDFADVKIRPAKFG